MDRGGGPGTVLDALGNYDNTVVVGSLSKAFSCFGGFIGCTAELKELLKMKSSTFIFGGPVPPPYLEAILAALEILDSDEYDAIHARLAANVRRIAGGMERLGLAILGGTQPILSVLVGDEADTLSRRPVPLRPGLLRPVGHLPRRALSRGVLRIQANANHTDEAIDGLLASPRTAPGGGRHARPRGPGPAGRLTSRPIRTGARPRCWTDAGSWPR